MEKDMSAEEIKNKLLSNPALLMEKKPFYRGIDESAALPNMVTEQYINTPITAEPTSVKVKIISQDTFMKELDPSSHDVLFDENIPSITMKTQNGGYLDLKFSRVAVPFQKLIKMKQVLHITGNPLQHTLVDENPTEKEINDFMLFKQYWKRRNQEGMKHKMVDTQKSFGDAGLLYYLDRKKQIKSRLISYKDGYVICSHNDDNGDRLIESIVYVKDNVHYIDSYDDEYMYRHKLDVDTDPKSDSTGWRLIKKEKHGFDEIPLVTKRGSVAWNEVQSAIETYEVIYNVFMAIQKRHGWGILYIKGNFDEKGRKLAGSIILNDNSIDGNGDAKFLTPPTPDGTIETLNLIEETIQKGACTTFILPKDIKVNGDVSGIAIQLTQSLDLENAASECIEWKNVADKMTRLFKQGLAKELVKSGKSATAVTDFANMDIDSEFRVWMPRNDYEYNQMIQMMYSSNLVSQETGIELNTLSKPDEKARVQRETEEAERKEEEKAKAEQDNQIGFNATKNDGNNNENNKQKTA